MSSNLNNCIGKTAGTAAPEANTYYYVWPFLKGQPTSYSPVNLEEDLGQDAQNISTATRDSNISPTQAILGPEQGGASSVNDPDKD
eukprot:1140504-Ditylum_brightwellii.AAC.1